MCLHDDDKNDESSDTGTVRYFAIGAMMNPTSVRLRNIHPLSSRPAKLAGYRLHFFGEVGSAEALQASEGSCIHGVIHVIRPEELIRLDKIEAGYDKAHVTAETYDGERLDVFVYTRHGDEIRRGSDHDNPPSERYMQIMIDGAEAHGVDGEYIRYLKGHQVEPRTKPSEYLSFQLPDSDGDSGRVYTREKIQYANGKDGRDMLVTLNGKVLRVMCSHDEVFARRWIDNRVNHCELYYSRAKYEPMFGEPPVELEGYTKDHCEYIEDMIFRRVCALAKLDGGPMKFACVGRYDQVYKRC